MKTVNYCFVLPYLLGGVELAKKFAQENGHGKDHDDFYKAASISRERVWIQRAPPGTGAPDVEIISIDANDPANSLLLQIILGLKFREFAKKAFGIDFSGPPPPLNENIIDWNEK